MEQEKKTYKPLIMIDFVENSKFPREYQSVEGIFSKKEAKTYGLTLAKKILEDDGYFTKDRGDTVSLYPRKSIAAVHLSIKEAINEEKGNSKQAEEGV
jgi:hypothetical protein